MKVGCVIVAAGAGKRMGAGEDKLFRKLSGIPLLAMSLKAFQSDPRIGEIVLVVNESAGERFGGEIRDRYRLSKVKRLTAGGPRRQDSVYNGLLAFADPPELVLIHDGDRPFVDRALIDAVLGEVSSGGGAIAAVRAKDTVKLADDRQSIVRTLEREAVWLAQTPQGFPYQKILSAHRLAREKGWEATDDAALVERAGGKVRIVEGSYDNIKITTAEDWELARQIHRRRTARANKFKSE